MKFPIKDEYSRQHAINILKACDLKKDNMFELKQIRKKRTVDQNALMWCWLNFIEAETGNDADFMHEWFKEKFCPEKSKTFNGVEIKIKSTKLLDTKEKTDYLEKIKIFMMEKAQIYLMSINDPQFHLFYSQYKK